MGAVDGGRQGTRRGAAQPPAPASASRAVPRPGSTPLPALLPTQWAAPAPTLTAVASEGESGCSCLANGKTLVELWKTGNYSETAGTTMAYERQTSVLHAHMLLNLAMMHSQRAE